MASDVNLLMAGFALLFGLALVWFRLAGQPDWPPEHRVPSPRSRLAFRSAFMAFTIAMISYALLQFASYFGFISDFTLGGLGAVFAVVFFAGALPLAWYRIRHGLRD
jgi:hypothetical protein